MGGKGIVFGLIADSKSWIVDGGWWMDKPVVQTVSFMDTGVA
jgi:hypothetical protein